jgi:hypothetical protein
VQGGDVPIAVRWETSSISAMRTDDTGALAARRIWMISNKRSVRRMAGLPENEILTNHY